MGQLTIPPSAVVYADTSIIIYTVEENLDYYQLLQPLWSLFQTGEIEIISSELTPMETLVVPLRNTNAVIVDGDRVVTCGTFTDTHRREFQCLPATNKQVKFAIMHIDRVENGKIVEHWGQGGQLGLIQQLGIIPIPGPALYPKIFKSLLLKLFNNRLQSP